MQPSAPRLARLAGIIALAAVLAAGCSSSRPTARAASLPTSTAVTAHATPHLIATSTAKPPAPTPEQAALVLAHRMVAAAVLPSGVKPTTVALPPQLRGSYFVSPGRNYVEAHSEWTIDESASSIEGFLEAHPPHGLIPIGHGSATDTHHGLQSLEVDSVFIPLPLNVSDARMTIGVERDPGSEAVVAVVANVQWTRVRPANSYVPTRDRVVTVSVVREYDHGAIGQRVIVTDPARVARIVRVFNGLRMAPFDVGGCGASGVDIVSYRVAFATSAAARPDLTGTLPFCRGIDVSIRGRNIAHLDSSAFAGSVARVLGSSQTYLSFTDGPRR